MKLLSQSSPVTFEHFSIDNGMSANGALCIYQDRTGYLWFGTYSGVDRYDGYSFKSYRHDPGNRSSITNGLVQALYEDRHGDFWIGTFGGLDRLDRTTGIFTHFTPFPPGPGMELRNYVSAIHEDRDGVLWVGTREGLNKLDRTTGTFTSLRHDSTDPGSLSNNSIGAIHEDNAGTLWIGTDRGLDKLDRGTGRFIHYLRDQYWIRSIYEDKTGTLWLGTGNGLVEFAPTTGIYTKYIHAPANRRSLSNNTVTSISEGEAGVLWIGTLLGGLNAFDKTSKQFTQYVHDEKNPGSLSSSGVLSVCRERSGTLWVGTPNQGVNKLNRPRMPFVKYPYENIHIRGSVLCDLFEGNAGKLWIRSSNGWETFDPVTEQFVGVPLDDGSNLLAEDQAGNLWIGSMSGGLSRRDRQGQIVSVRDSSGREFRQDVMCLCKGRNGEIWIGTAQGGIFVVDQKAMRITLLEQTRVQINTIFEDAAGLLWVGTWQGGVLCYDRKRQASVRHVSDPQDPASMSGDVVFAIYEDKVGKLWLGTGDGIVEFDRTAGTFARYGQNDGVSAVFGILEDDDSDLWITTGKGISHFDRKKATFKHYDVSYGLAGNMFRPQSAFRATNGEMFLAGTKGLTRFHPDSIRDNPFVPPIVFTTFRKFEQPFPIGQEIRFPHTDNFLSFEFAALSYVSPEKNQYAYKMEGLDEDWVYSGTRRYAGYPHLEPGEYVFKVKGSNNDGVWNEEGASIVVIITPPFWATWWFRGVAFIALFVTVGGSIRYVEIRKLKRTIEQLEQDRAVERERVRLSQDMHDEIGSSLTEIAILSELIKKNIKKPTEATTLAQQMSDRSAEVIDNIGEIIWAINPKNDSLDNVIAHIRRHTVEYLKLTSIKCHFVVPDEIPPNHLSAEARRNIFLVVKEATHNVVKHSKASEVTVHVTMNDGRMELSIRDNGKGFSCDEKAGSGSGLHNMKKRIAEIGGTFLIESEMQHGTNINITVLFT